MSTGSTIEWTGATWNPVVGCTRVSAGCDKCYAVRQSYRLERMGQEKYAGLTVLNPRGDRHFNGVVRCDEAALTIPLGWRKPRRIFVNSMSDLFHAGVPFEFIDRVFAVMALCPQHTFQVLTKRPERMAEYMSSFDDDTEVDCASGMFRLGMAAGRMLDGDWIWNEGKRHRRSIEHFISDTHDYYDEDEERDPKEVPWPLPNVWLGTSVENQDAADERIPHLLRCPAEVRWISQEPQLWPVVYRDEWAAGLHWIVGGGESGPGARPYDLAWPRETLGWCRRHGIPYFQKQLGRWPFSQSESERWSPRGAPILVDVHSLAHWEFRDRFRDPKGGDMAEWPEDLRVREWPDGLRVREWPDTGGKDGG